MSIQTQQIANTAQGIAASTHQHDAEVFQWGGGAYSALLHLIYYQSAENSGSQLNFDKKQRLFGTWNDQQFNTVAVTCQTNLLRPRQASHSGVIYPDVIVIGAIRRAIATQV